MKKSLTMPVMFAVAGLMVVTAPHQADARSKYLKTMRSKYENVADQLRNCAVCHGGQRGSDKELLSDYGTKLKQALGTCDESDTDKITAAFDKVAREECGNHKTYGDLLKEGQLPPRHPEAE